MRQSLSKRWLAFWLGWLLLGCTAVSDSIPPTAILPAPMPTALSTTILPLPEATTTSTPDSGWELLRPGLEQRHIQLTNSAGERVEQLTLLRLEPDQFVFQIAYRPGAPQLLVDWQTETGALLVVNGGFFTETYEATGLIVVDGVASGQSYGDFAGMLAIIDAGPEIRWLAERPYDSNESLNYALQSFPMLVRPGGRTGYPEEDGQPNRRTVIAQDKDGRILFIFAPWGHFTLYQLGQYLLESDLGLDVALNLDGGTSTGFVLAEPAETVPAFVALPTVITVYPR